MKKINPKLLVVYLFVLLSMTFSVWQLGVPSAFANEPEDIAGVCCDVSSDCSGSKICYDPWGGERNCSRRRVGYCK